MTQQQLLYCLFHSICATLSRRTAPWGPIKLLSHQNENLNQTLLESSKCRADLPQWWISQAFTVIFKYVYVFACRISDDLLYWRHLSNLKKRLVKIMMIHWWGTVIDLFLSTSSGVEGRTFLNKEIPFSLLLLIHFFSVTEIFTAFYSWWCLDNDMLQRTQRWPAALIGVSSNAMMRGMAGLNYWTDQLHPHVQINQDLSVTEIRCAQESPSFNLPMPACGARMPLNCVRCSWERD